jgi:hypothetical protein
MKTPLLEKELKNSPQLKIIRKEERQNQLVRYCEFMEEYTREKGMFYKEAKRYVPTMLKKK